MAAASGSKESHLPEMDVEIKWLIFNKTSDSESIKSRGVKTDDILDFFQSVDALLMPFAIQRQCTTAKWHRFQEDPKESHRMR